MSRSHAEHIHKQDEIHDNNCLNETWCQSPQQVAPSKLKVLLRKKEGVSFPHRVELSYCGTLPAPPSGMKQMLGVIICKYASPRACFQMIAAIFNAVLDVFARPPAKRERLSAAAPLCSHHQLFISSHPPSLFPSTSPFNLSI